MADGRKTCAPPLRDSDLVCYYHRVNMGVNESPVTHPSLVFKFVFKRQIALKLFNCTPSGFEVPMHIMC